MNYLYLTALNLAFCSCVAFGMVGQQNNPHIIPQARLYRILVNRYNEMPNLHQQQQLPQQNINSTK